MILLKEQFVALLFSTLCFAVSLISGVLNGAALYSVCIRSVIVALLGYMVGWICGTVIKSLFLETMIDAEALKKGKKAEPVVAPSKADKKQ